PRPGTPPVQPRWADIAAGEQSGWKTVNNKRRAAEKALKRAQSSSVRPGDLKPAKGEHKQDRRLIFRCSDPKVSHKAPREDVILTLNRFLTQAGFPSFMRIVDANYTETGALSALLNRGALAEKLVSAHRDPLLAACRQADSTVIAVELNEQWHRVKVHGVSVDRYGTRAAGLTLAREEIEMGTDYRLMRNPTWLRPLEAVRDQELHFSTIVITVKGLSDARRLIADGLRFGDTRHHTSPYYEVGKDSVCPRCCGIGHRNFRACGDRPMCCLICAGPHGAAQHACEVVGCGARQQRPCVDSPVKCANCGGGHQADSAGCPRIRDARRRRARPFPGIEVVVPSLREVEAQRETRPFPRIEVVVPSLREVRARSRAASRAGSDE
ncbi:hypothetical protein ACJ73_10319, partial [Blastomyces percursus]